VSTLVLSGGESLVALRKAAQAVDEKLPDSRIVLMPGQVHPALATPAPSCSRPRC
jgi:hypothetical protein